MADNRVQIVINADAGGAIAGFRQVDTGLQAMDQSVASRARGISASFGSIYASMAKVRSFVPGIFAGFGVMEVANQVISTSIAFERLHKSLQAIEGGVAPGAAEFEFIKSEANRLGLELFSTADAYKSLSAAAMGTNLQGEQTRRIFTSVAQAARVLGLSNEQVTGIFLALGQMISKGTVQAEELRGQLGERLPGAFQLAAKAMNMSTAELDKYMANGNLAATDFLPKFSKALDDRFGKEVPNSVSQTSAALNRLANAGNEFSGVFAEESGLTAGYTKFVDLMARGYSFLADYPDRLRRWAEGFEQVQNRWQIWPNGGFFDALDNAGRYSQTKHPTQPGVAAVLQAPYASRTMWGNTGLDEDTRRVQDFNLAAQVAKKRQEEWTRAVEASRTPLQILNDEMSKYNRWLREGLPQSQFDQLERKAKEDYQKATNRDTVTPLNIEELSRRLTQFDMKYMETLQSLASADNEFYANQAERSGEFYKAEEIRMNERMSKRRGAYDKDMALLAESLKEMEREVGQYELVNPDVEARLGALRQLLKELRNNEGARKAQIDAQEREQAGYNTTLKTDERNEQLAQLNLDYAKLTGSMQAQLTAEIALIDATARRYELEHPGELSEAYRKVANEQKKSLMIQKDGSFGSGFWDALDKYKRTLPTAFQEGGKVFDSLKQGIGDAADALADFTTTGKMDFSSFADSVLKDILRIEYEALLTRAIMGGSSGAGLVGWLGGLLGSGSTGPTMGANGVETYAGIGHSGGMAGALPDGRSVPAHLFWSAPRLHGGLAPDEFPAILQSGERVLNRRETAAYSQGGRAPNVTVNVDNRTGMPISKDNVSVTQSLEGTVVGIVLKNYARGGDIWKMIRGGKNG